MHYSRHPNYFSMSIKHKNFEMAVKWLSKDELRWMSLAVIKVFGSQLINLCFEFVSHDEAKHYITML